MFKKFFPILFLFGVCCLQIHAVGHEASLCLGVCNSTTKRVSFVVKQAISEITFSKTISDFEVAAKEHFLITEHFINFDQYVIGDSGDVVLREIDIMCEGALIGTMQLMCSKFCPAPYYQVKERSTSGFVVQKKKFKRGGAPTTLEIIEQK